MYSVNAVHLYRYRRTVIYQGRRPTCSILFSPSMLYTGAGLLYDIYNPRAFVVCLYFLVVCFVVWPPVIMAQKIIEGRDYRICRGMNREYIEVRRENPKGSLNSYEWVLNYSRS